MLSLTVYKLAIFLWQTQKNVVEKEIDNLRFFVKAYFDRSATSDVFFRTRK